MTLDLGPPTPTKGRGIALYLDNVCGCEQHHQYMGTPVHAVATYQ